MNDQMIRVISSPSSSTMGFFTSILAMGSFRVEASGSADPSGTPPTRASPISRQRAPEVAPGRIEAPPEPLVHDEPFAELKERECDPLHLEAAPDPLGRPMHQRQRAPVVDHL